MKKILIFLAITSVIAVFALNKFQNNEKPIVVETTIAHTYDLTRSVDASGELREYRSRSLSSGGYAIVDKIYVNVGDFVREGQVLMTFSPALTPAIDDTLTDVLVSAGLTAASGQDISSVVPGLSAEQIVAPFDGVVTAISAQIGEQVVPLLPAVSVSDISRIRAVVRLDASAAAGVEVGMPAAVRLSGGRRSYDGVVTSVSPVVKTSTSLTGTSERYCEAEIELYAPDDLSLSGTPVTAKINMAVRRGAVMAPYEAIRQTDGGSEYLFVLEQDGTAVRCAVVTGDEYDSLVEIRSGLSQGDVIIVSADGELVNGSSVVVKPE